MQNSRKLFLAGGGLTALAAATAVPSRAQAATKDDSVPPHRVRWASEFGARGNGRDDDTAALQAGLNWAGASRSVLLLDPGAYAVSSITIPAQAILRGASGGHARFGTAGRQVPSELISHPEANSTAPLVVMNGSGAHLENIGLTGGRGTDPQLYLRRPGIVVGGGIEVVLDRVRVFRFAATGIRVEQLNNARWTDVFVDDCGTKEAPAVRIESKECTNYVQFDGLTIERSANTALDIATGDDPVRDWAANLVFSGLHIESNTDNASGNELNTSPLIDIGNVRAVTFVAPQLLGRPAALIRYRQQISASVAVEGKPGGDARDQQGGVQILGGHLKQHGGGDAASRVATVEVTGNGRGVAIIAAKFDALWCPGVLIRKDYGHDVTVQASTFRRAGEDAGWPASKLDERSPEAQRVNADVLHGSHRLSGGSLDIEDGAIRAARGASLSGAGLALSAASKESRTSFVAGASVSGGWVSPSQGAGTDIAGRIYCRADATVSGELFRVDFAEARDEAPIVLATARNAAAAKAHVFVDARTTTEGKVTGFVVSATESVQPAAGILFFDYVVIGRER